MHRFKTWGDALQFAPDESVLALVVEDYVAKLAPGLLAVLPENCQRVLREAPINVAAAAVTLMQAELTYQGSDETRAVLHEVAHTFAAASFRLVQPSGHMEPVIPAAPPKE